MKRSLSIAFCLFLAMSAVPSLLWAQDVASVTGVVTDTSDAVVVGAGVALVNTTTNASYNTKTTSLGSYLIMNVPPGPGYKLTFTQSGFRPHVVTDIYLAVASTRTQNAKLHAGDVSQTIEVSAANDEVTINTTDATVGNNFDVKLLNDLPVQVRDSPSALFSLQPGVAASSFTGARTDQTDITVDGMDVNDITTGQTFLVVANAPVDSLEEFRGTVAGQVSSAGPGGGGQFQIVTKSGTNAFHGDLNEYHRDTSTVANLWFNNDAGVARSPLIRNQFGGQLGGPIKKDKAFFFFNFYDSRIIQSTPEDPTVPLDTYRNGNVSYILATPSSGTGTCSFTSRENTTPLCIGTLTPAQVKALDPNGVGFSSVVQGFLNSRYPHANDLTLGDGINTGGFRFNAPNPDYETNYVIKVDYTLSPTMKLYGRTTMNRENATKFPIAFPGDPVSNPFIDRSYSYVIGHTWTIGTSKANQFSYGDTIEKYDFANTYDPTGATVLGFGEGLGDPYNTQQVQKRRIPIPVVRDDFTWTRGSHNISFGGTFKFVKTESQQILDFNFLTVGLGGLTTNLNPTLRPANIRGGSTAPSLYDSAFALAVGRIGEVSTNYNYTAAGNALPQGTGHIRRYRYYQTELYAGDTWKATKELTFTYGLRYQYYSVPYEVNGAESVTNYSFDKYFAARVAQSGAGQLGNSAVPFISYSLGGKANGGAPLYQPDYKDFAPRFSFAFNPHRFPKTVFNGGAGIVYDRTVMNALNFLQDQSSYLFQNNVTTPYGNPASANAALANDPRVGSNFAFTNPDVAPTITKPFTPFVSGGVPYGLYEAEPNFSIDSNIKDPYSITLDAGVQQALPGNMVLKVSYVGRLGRRLLGFADTSQLIDFPDKTSGQMMSTAFANMETQIRGGTPTTNLTAQPWFEHILPPGYGASQTYIDANGNTQNYPNNTSFVADAFAPYPVLGDLADTIWQLQAGGYIDSNVGLATQFGQNTTATNKGFSSYNGMLVTLDKNLSHGLKFDVNYTYSHSIDNASFIANSYPGSAGGVGYGFICDVLHPRSCRGNSDFDETHVINANFTYSLPIGRGKTFESGAPRWLDEAIGGWAVSGIPSWHSGVAFSAFANAYLAGFANDAPPIFNGKRSVIHAHVHKNSDGSINLFDNPTAASNTFSGPLGLEVGSRNNLRGPGAWGMDAGLAKTFPIVMDRIVLKFRADAFNVFNHPTFAPPSQLNSDYTSTTGTFGLVSTQTGTPRVLQLALRLEF